jgi:hypothetical protein
MIGILKPGASLFSAQLPHVFLMLGDVLGNAVNDLLKRLHQVGHSVKSVKSKIKPWHLCAFKCHGFILAGTGSRCRLFQGNSRAGESLPFDEDPLRLGKPALADTRFRASGHRISHSTANREAPETAACVVALLC